MTTIEEIEDDVPIILASVRHSIDRDIRYYRSQAEREAMFRLLMMVEEARIRFTTYMRYKTDLSLSDWESIRSELVIAIKNIAESPELASIGPRKSFRFLLAPRSADPPSLFMKAIRDKDNRPRSIAEALSRLRNYLETAQIDVPPAQGLLSLETLNRIVPDQQVAPVQFEIVNNRITIVDRPPDRHLSDRSNIESALSHIVGSGEKLISNLENSNCDKRLLASVKELQSQLTADKNIIKIGLTNIACAAMGLQFKSELPDAVSAMFSSYSTSITLYVAQFPEWENFTQRAANLELDDSDVAEVDATAAEIVDKLSANAELADPEVPKTIAFLRELLAFPGRSSKRATYAMIRTLENLLSSILRHSMSFLTKTAEKTIEAGSTATSRVLVGGLLSIALISATGIESAALRAGSPWVQQVAQTIQKHLEKAIE